MTEREDDKITVKKAEEFLQVFKKGAEFTQELLKENERLRYQVLKLEETLKHHPDADGSNNPETLKLRQRIDELEREKQEILGRIKQVEAENENFATRYVEIEEENNNLANLYIASYQLHSTLDFREVLQIIMEIIINLVGAEDFSTRKPTSCRRSPSKVWKLPTCRRLASARESLVRWRERARTTSSTTWKTIPGILGIRSSVSL